MVDGHKWQALCAARGLTDEQLRRTDPFFRKDVVRMWPRFSPKAKAMSKVGLQLAREDTRLAQTRTVVVWQDLGDPTPEQQAELTDYLQRCTFKLVDASLPGCVLVQGDPKRVQQVLESGRRPWRASPEGRLEMIGD